MTANSTTGTSKQETTGLPLNSPELDPSRKKLPSTPPVRAIRDEIQAAQVITRLINDNSYRNMLNARIMAAYNAERPWPQDALEQEGLLWKSNFSTQPLPMLIDRVGPRFAHTIASAKYITSSALPDDVPGASKKTEAFRREITSLFRGRPESQELISEIAQETSLFGYTCAGHTDEYGWFPTHFRGDRFLIPAGTRQLSTKCPVTILVECLLPHELFELIKDTEAARTAGWDLKNTIEVINRAMPENVASKYSETARIYEDLIRENNLANALQSTSKIVKIYNVFVTEVTGKVSHWKLASAESGYKSLFTRPDRFDSMSQVATFFSFQQANGTMHGSKGIGRLVYNMARVIDRARNEVVDRLQLSGKILIQGDEKAIRKFKMHVVGNAVLVGTGFNVVSEAKINPAVKEFFDLDQYMSALLDQMVGNVSPRFLQGERVTKAQVELYASREEESKDTPIARFLSQFSNLVTEIQRRACSEQCDDEDAKAMQKRLLAIMSREELDRLAKSPSAEVVQDLTDQERQMITLVATENQGNPLYDQYELAKRKLTAQVNEQFAEAVLLPQNDATRIAEQSRAQMMENELLLEGAEVPVSPRDGHRVHLDLLWPAIDAQVQTLLTNPENGALVRVLLAHARAHAQMGVATGEQQQSFAGDLQKITVVEERLAQLEAHEAELAAAAQAGLPPTEAIAQAQTAAGVPGASLSPGAPPALAPTAQAP